MNVDSQWMLPHFALRIVQSSRVSKAKNFSKPSFTTSAVIVGVVRRIYRRPIILRVE